jgi:hypothetical protein
VHFFEDDGSEKDEGVPVDVADEADEKHRQGGNPIILGGGHGRRQQFRIRKIRFVEKEIRIVGWGEGFRELGSGMET